MSLALIGFGEAGSTFARGGGWATARAFDRQSDDPAARSAVAARYTATAVAGQSTLAAALAGADAVLSVVTADQALAAALAAAAHIARGALFFDMNSVAPATKVAAAAAVAAVGGRYVDVAIMAPVDPAGRGVPLLVSGPHGDDGAAALVALGFTDVRVLAGPVGRASAVKMIRSVLVKGVEALTAEMMLAGDAAGVTEEVLASLGDGWARTAAYNLDRMRVHGVRRAAEMSEVAATLTALGVAPVMTRGTIRRQAARGGPTAREERAA